jgi:hypothetical protein
MFVQVYKASLRAPVASDHNLASFNSALDFYGRR